MPLTLTIRNVASLDNGSPVAFVLDRRGALIGRAATADWCLPDPALHISSRHCEIRFADDRYELVDHSTNGTFLNGQQDRPGRRVPDRRLRDRGKARRCGGGSGCRAQCRPRAHPGMAGLERGGRSAGTATGGRNAVRLGRRARRQCRTGRECRLGFLPGAGRRRMGGLARRDRWQRLGHVPRIAGWRLTRAGKRRLGAGKRRTRARRLARRHLGLGRRAAQSAAPSACGTGLVLDT